MIEQLKDVPSNTAGFVFKERVTNQDYETVLVPAVEKAFNEQKKLRLYYQIDPDFTGIDFGAAWQDFKVGLRHLSQWERVAAVTDVGWIKHAVHLFGFFIPAPVKVFPLSETAKAREWITAGPRHGAA